MSAESCWHPDGDCTRDPEGVAQSGVAALRQVRRPAELSRWLGAEIEAAAPDGNEEAEFPQGTTNRIESGGSR
jgi:hypothetical protein